MPDPAAPARSGDADVLEAVLASVAGGMGLDGPRVAAAMRRGEPLAAALGLPEGTVDLVYARAHASFLAGRHPEAERLFRALTMLDGRRPDHWLGYGICLRMRDEPALALQLFEVAATLAPAKAAPWFHLLEAAIASRNVPAAERALAAYDASAGEDLSPEARHEAERLRRALAQLRSGRR